MSTFPFCCSQQRPAGTNGLLSVSLGSGEQFVSIKQDGPHLPQPQPLLLPSHTDLDGFCAAGKTLPVSMFHVRARLDQVETL